MPTQIDAPPMPQGGFPQKVSGTISPRMIHSGGSPAAAAADFTNATPVITEEYFAEVLVPFRCVVTGLAVFNGSDVTGNTLVTLRDQNGTVLAQSASTAGSGTDAYQRIPFTASLVVNPGTYYVSRQQSSATARVNMHAAGNFGAGKLTGGTYGTPITGTMPVTFTADLGPVISLY